MTGFGLFWLATFHFLLAGTDVGHPLARWGVDLAAAVVVFLSLVRILAPRGRPVPRTTTTRPPGASAEGPTNGPTPSGEPAASRLRSANGRDR